MLERSMGARTGILIVAGGRSSRMGQDKAWLPCDGRPALERVAQVALQSGADEVVVVGTPGQSLPSLPVGVARCNDPIDRRHQGPLSGIAVGLRHLCERGVSVASLAACDSLWINQAHLTLMIRTLEHNPAILAVVPETGPQSDGYRGMHPLCGALRVQAGLSTADTLLRAGRRAARMLFVELDARRIAVSLLPDPRVVNVCNSPQQWAQAVALIRGEGSPTGPAAERAKRP